MNRSTARLNKVVLASLLAILLLMPISSRAQTTLSGCYQATVLPALENAAAYSTTQSYATAYQLVQQPNSYFNCLQGLLGQAQSLANLFNGSGNFTSFITSIAQQVLTGLLNSLEAAACTQINQVIGGVGGGLFSGGNMFGSVTPQSISALITQQISP